VGEGGQRDTRHADPGCADARRADTYGRILERNIGGPRNVILEPVRKDGVSKGPMRPLNINRARIEDLMQLPGIGRKRAEKIVLYRDAVGGFKTLDDLLEIPGFGEGIVRRLDGLVAF
jgi:competence ComEA-like helix-hairpin-helix protein